MPSHHSATTSRTATNSSESDEQTYHHGDLRNALIAEGRRQINEVGANDLSLRNLVRSIGVSIAAPSYHFGDKEGLLAAIATDGFNELAARRREVGSTATDPAQRVFRIMACYIEFAEREKGLFNLMVGPQILKRPHKDLWEASMVSFDLFAEAVQDYALSKKWPHQDLNLVVHAAWSVEHGMATLLLEHRAPFPRRRIEIDRMVQFSLNLLLSGIAAGPAKHTLVAKRTLGDQ